MQHSASVHIEPDTDMDRIAGLAHQYAVTFLWLVNENPAFAFRVVAKIPSDSEKVFRVWDRWQFTAKLTLLHMTNENCPALPHLPPKGCQYRFRPSASSRQPRKPFGSVGLTRKRLVADVQHPGPSRYLKGIGLNLCQHQRNWRVHLRAFKVR